MNGAEIALRRKGEGVGGSNGNFRLQSGDGNVLRETKIEYVCVRARDNDACEERQMKLYHAMWENGGEG